MLRVEERRRSGRRKKNEALKKKGADVGRGLVVRGSDCVGGGCNTIRTREKKTPDTKHIWICFISYSYYAFFGFFLYK